MLLKIWKNYYLDASSVYYALKKAHAKADGGVEYDTCSYHARLEEALAERLESEARGLLQSICPADKALTSTLKNNKCA